MSDTETHYGKLRKVDLQGKTKEEFFQKLCEEKNVKKHYDSWEETWKGWVNDGETYYINNDDVYEVYDHIKSNYDDIQHLIPHEDGTFTFVMSFYNGGTCLGEMIDDSFQKHNKENGK